MVFIVYKDPTTKYEKYIERFCLRAKKKTHINKKKTLFQMPKKPGK